MSHQQHLSLLAGHASTRQQHHPLQQHSAVHVDPSQHQQQPLNRQGAASTPSAAHGTTPSIPPPPPQMAAFQQNGALPPPGVDFNEVFRGMTPEQQAFFLNLAQSARSGQFPLPPATFTNPQPHAAPAAALPTANAPRFHPPDQSVPSTTSAPPQQDVDVDLDLDKEDGEVEEGEVEDAPRSPKFLRTPPKGPRVRSRSPFPRSAPTQPGRRASQQRQAINTPRPSVASRKQSNPNTHSVRATNGKAASVQSKTPSSHQKTRAESNRDTAVEAFVSEMFKAGYGFGELSKEIESPVALRAVYKRLGLPLATTAEAPAQKEAEPVKPVPEQRKISTTKKPAPKPPHSDYAARLQAAKSKKPESANASPTTPHPFTGSKATASTAMLVDTDLGAIISDPTPLTATAAATIASPRSTNPGPTAIQLMGHGTSPTPPVASTPKRVRTLDRDLLRRKMEALEAERAAKAAAAVSSTSAGPSSPAVVQRYQSPSNIQHGLGEGLMEAAAKANEASITIIPPARSSNSNSPMTANPASIPRSPAPVTAASPTLNRGYGLPGLFTMSMPPPSPVQTQPVVRPTGIPFQGPAAPISRPQSSLSNVYSAQVTRPATLNRQHSINFEGNVIQRSSTGFGKAASAEESFVIIDSDVESEDETNTNGAPQEYDQTRDTTARPVGPLNDFPPKKDLRVSSGPSTPGVSKTAPTNMTPGEVQKALENKLRAKIALEKQLVEQLARQSLAKRQKLASGKAKAVQTTQVISPDELKPLQLALDTDMNPAMLTSEIINISELPSSLPNAHLPETQEPLQASPTLEGAPPDANVVRVAVSQTGPIEQQEETSGGVRVNADEEDDEEDDFYEPEPEPHIGPSPTHINEGSKHVLALRACENARVLNENEVSPSTERGECEPNGGAIPSKLGKVDLTTVPFHIAVDPADVQTGPTASDADMDDDLDDIYDQSVSPRSLQAALQGPAHAPVDESIKSLADDSIDDSNDDSTENSREDPDENPDEKSKESSDEDANEGPSDELTGDMTSDENAVEVSTETPGAEVEELEDDGDDMEISDSPVGIVEEGSDDDDYEPQPADLYTPQQTALEKAFDETDQSKDQPSEDGLAVDDDLAPELQPSATETAFPVHDDLSQEPRNAFVPYESPLIRFKDFRYHPEYLKLVSSYKSMTYSHRIDADKIVCRYETGGGICNAKDCPYQHFRSMALDDNEILRFMGTQKLPTRTPEDEKRWKAGLSTLVQELRASGQGKDVSAIAKRIAEFRRAFIGDDSKVLVLD